MLYHVHITNHGVPCEAWEILAATPEQACEHVQAERTATGAHTVFDLYEATEAPDVSDDADEAAYAFALQDAAARMPALAELLRERMDETLAGLESLHAVGC